MNRKIEVTLLLEFLDNTSLNTIEEDILDLFQNSPLYLGNNLKVTEINELDPADYETFTLTWVESGKRMETVYQTLLAAFNSADILDKSPLVSKASISIRDSAGRTIHWRG